MSKKNYTNYSNPETFYKPTFDKPVNNVVEEEACVNGSPVEETVVEEPVTKEVKSEEPIVEAVEPDSLTNSIIFGVVKTNSALRVRQEPNSNGEILGTIANGTEVEVNLDNSTNEFYKICTASGLDGYCMKKFIALK